jgi:hypothetical protein
MRMERWNQSNTWCVGPKLAASPRDRGPSAPSLKIVIGVVGVAPRPCSTPRNCALPVSFGGHAAEHDLLSVVVAHLREEDLERTHAVAANGTHMAAVDGQGDRSRLVCRRGRLNRRLPLQSGTYARGAAAGCLNRRDVRDRQELRQQCPGTAVGQQRSHLGNQTLVFGRASVGHDRGDRAEC